MAIAKALGPFVVERNWSASRTVASVAIGQPAWIVSVNLPEGRVVDLGESAALTLASLFAASPQLLKACRDYLAWLDRALDRECLAAIVEAMRLAVDKADGR